MQQWEYRTVSIRRIEHGEADDERAGERAAVGWLPEGRDEGSPLELSTILAAYGANGWELVSLDPADPTPSPTATIGLSERTYQAIFKRPKHPTTRAEPIYDSPEDLRTLAELLVEGETIEAIFSSPHEGWSDGLKWLGITSHRIVLCRSESQKRGRDSTKWTRYESVPYHRVLSVTIHMEDAFSRGVHRQYQSWVTLGLRAEDYRSAFGWERLDTTNPANARQAHDLILSHLL